MDLYKISLLSFVPLGTWLDFCLINLLKSFGNAKGPEKRIFSDNIRRLIRMQLSNSLTRYLWSNVSHEALERFGLSLDLDQFPFTVTCVP